MATPLDLITKPVQFGIQATTGLARGAIGAIRDFTGGGEDDMPPPPPPERDEQSQPVRRRPAAKRQASRKPKPLSDVAITRKVETTIFRDSEVPKGQIVVNTADAVVQLRGEARTPEMIKALEAQAQAVPEVKRVENLLHLPKTPAPTRATLG
jgi:hypothetical protein